MSEQKPPNPGRRRFFEELFTTLGREAGRAVREARQVDRELRQSATEIQESLTSAGQAANSAGSAEESVPVASAQLEELEAGIERLEAEVQRLISEKAEASLLQEDDRQLVRQLLTQLAEREQEQRDGSAADETTPTGETEERRQRWDVAGKRLGKLILLLIGWLVAKSPDVIYETVFGNEVYPWVKEQWHTFFAQAEAAGVIEQSPLSSPLPSPTTESPSPIATPTPKPETPTPPRRPSTGSGQETRRAGRIPVPEMVTVPAGHFWMGSDKRIDKDARDNELPQHWLYLPGYRIGKYPVTNEEYAAFLAATGHHEPNRWEESRAKLDHPVTGVSWNDVMAYCRWPSEATGRVYRLPSEAEWEKAARGSDGRIWPWGNQPPDEQHCNFNGKDTTPVGSYPAGVSPYGCYDMAGNVWEWTNSRYEKYPYRADDGREAERIGGTQVLRGGSFFNSRLSARCAFRYWDKPDGWPKFIGFRLLSPGG